MLVDIITKTPLFVWAILAFLVYRGIIASRTREVAVPLLAIIPAAMLALSLQSMNQNFHLRVDVLCAWLLGAIGGGYISWLYVGRSAIEMVPQRAAVIVRGSWIPMMMLMAIFLIRYALAVSLAIKPALATSTIFVLTACCALGVFNGGFIGSALRRAMAYRTLIRAQKQLEGNSTKGQRNRERLLRHLKSSATS